MKIGELAARTGVTAKTIRFWESTGLDRQPRWMGGRGRCTGLGHDQHGSTDAYAPS